MYVYVTWKLITKQRRNLGGPRPKRRRAGVPAAGDGILGAGRLRARRRRAGRGGRIAGRAFQRRGVCLRGIRRPPCVWLVLSYLVHVMRFGFMPPLSQVWITKMPCSCFLVVIVMTEIQEWMSEWMTILRYEWMG